MATGYMLLTGASRGIGHATVKLLAHEFGPRGVRANAIAPGEIETSMLSQGTDRLVEEEVPMHRLGSPREVAEKIYFLCSGASSYITAPKSTSTAASMSKSMSPESGNRCRDQDMRKNIDPRTGAR